MAISDAKKRKIGKQLVDWIYLGVRTGARRGVEVYQQNKVDNLLDAIGRLKWAVDRPNKARARIDHWIATWDAANGAGTGQTFLGECLALFGSVTLGQINTELTIWENYAQGLVDHVNVDAWTWDQVATDIENKVAKESDDWTFFLPPGYLDIWGE